MATITRLHSRETAAIDSDFGGLKTITMFCATGLFVSLVFAICGLDLVGFF